MRHPLSVFNVTNFAKDFQGLHVGRWRLATNTAVWAFRVGNVLIDTGPPNQWHRVQEFLHHQPRIDTLVVTHHHEDHAGNIGRIWSDFQHNGRRLTVFAPAKSISRLQAGYEVEWYRAFVWGRYPLPRHPIPILPLPLDLKVSLDGDSVSLRSVSAAGHSNDHTVLYVPERKWLFSADLYVTAKPKMAFKEEEPLHSIAALRKITSGNVPHDDHPEMQYPLDVTDMYCAHRGHVKQGIEKLQQRLEWLEHLRDRAAALHREGVHTHKQIAHRLLGREDEALFYLSRGDFSRENLIRGLLRDVT